MHPDPRVAALAEITIGEARLTYTEQHAAAADPDPRLAREVLVAVAWLAADYAAAARLHPHGSAERAGYGRAAEALYDRLDRHDRHTQQDVLNRAHQARRAARRARARIPTPRSTQPR